MNNQITIGNNNVNENKIDDVRGSYDYDDNENQNQYNSSLNNNSIVSNKNNLESLSPVSSSSSAHSMYLPLTTKHDTVNNNEENYTS